VTGLGIASSLGVDEASVWENLCAGRTGIGRLTRLDTSGHKCHVGAEVAEPEVTARLARLGVRASDRALDLALIAGADALEQAGLVDGPRPKEEQDVAVVFGTGVGSAQAHQEAFASFFERGVRGLRPTTVPRCMYNAISSGLSIHFRLTGANLMIVTACTAGTNAIGTAFRWVRHGYADAVLCGGTDGFFTPFFFGVWNNLGVLSSNPDPLAACRPFAADRDGCVLGEGAGALVLESAERAEQRGVRIRGEIVGYGESSDASHRTRPSAAGQVKAMRRALEDAGVDPAELGLINAHGTATLTNDACESRSICEVLGEAVDRVPVAANKSYFGHTLGASGALETIVTLLSLEHRLIPPNLNLDRVDPQCEVLLAGSEPLPMKADVAMKNSFGFGGGNGVLIVKGATQ